jgi:hypothetical protein
MFLKKKSQREFMAGYGLTANSYGGLHNHNQVQFDFKGGVVLMLRVCVLGSARCFESALSLSLSLSLTL